MAALCLSVRQDGEWMLVHQCVECKTLKVNRIAGDDNVLVLLRLALRPLADPRLRSARVASALMIRPVQSCGSAHDYTGTNTTNTIPASKPTAVGPRTSPEYSHGAGSAGKMSMNMGPVYVGSENGLPIGSSGENVRDANDFHHH